MRHFTFSSANTDIQNSLVVKVPAKEARNAPVIRMMPNITPGTCKTFYFRRKEKSENLADKFDEHRQLWPNNCGVTPNEENLCSSLLKYYILLKTHFK